MCGICGIINKTDALVHEESIRKMMARMKHRGPDDEGVFISQNIGLGFVRLSIIDLSSAGHQPMKDHDGRYTIIYNGEVYNYIELRAELEESGISFVTKTDTEVVLKSYMHWGADCLSKFNGMFAFVIYDREEEEVFAARDRFGIKPFYYCVTDDKLVFASEIPSILETNCIEAEPDNQVIFDYLAFNRTDQTENTFFKGIKKLQHGNYWVLKNKELKIKQWYNLRESAGKAIPFKDGNEYRELFDSAINLRLRSDVPIGVCLSGGLDSSSIASVLLQKDIKNDLNSFSAVYNKNEEGDESEFIDEYKTLIKNMHFVTPTVGAMLNDISYWIRIHAEPIPSLSPYAQYKVMQKAKENVVVTLDGQGADECLAGYHYFYGFYFKDLLRSMQIKQLLHEMRMYWRKHHSLLGYITFIFFLLPKIMRTQIRANQYGCIDKKFMKRYANDNRIAGNLYGSATLSDALFDHFEYKLEHLLKWDDRNSMANSIESRIPFLDYRLVERTLASDNSKRIKDGVTKSILRSAMQGILPEKIRNRMDKVGFETPQNDWFRTPEMKEFVYTVINDERFERRIYFNADTVKTLYKKHLRNEVNASKEIWKVFNLELWLEMFIDKK